MHKILRSFAIAFLIAALSHSAHAAAMPKKSKVDPAAAEILKGVEAAYRSLSAVSAHTQEISHQYGPAERTAVYQSYSSSIKLQRPNHVWLDVFVMAYSQKKKRMDHRHNMTLICDGRQIWRLWDLENNYYEKTSAAADGSNIMPYGGTDILFQGFFHPESAVGQDDPGILSIRCAGSAQWQDSNYRLLRVTYDVAGHPELGAASFSTLYFIGDDNLIHRDITNFTGVDGSSLDQDQRLDQLDPHPLLTSADFTFTPQPGATEKEQNPQTASPPAPQLLVNGMTAPDFTVQDRLGRPVHLSDYKGKIVVLDFWATWCGPCQASLPSTNTVARTFRNRNVVVLAVNVSDTLDAFHNWLPSHKQLDAIKFATDPTTSPNDVASKLYNVTGIPTQYVIGADGKIVHSFVGFGGSDDELVAAVRQALKGR